MKISHLQRSGLARLDQYCRRSLLTLGVVLFAAVATTRADPYDTLRQKWQSFLLTSSFSGTSATISSFNQSGHFLVNSSPASLSSQANGYWSSMNGSENRTSLWNDLPLGTVSGNITATFSRLQVMALAWATTGSSLHYDASLASSIISGLDWMNANIYSTTADRYNNWWDWVIGTPQSLDNTMVLIYPALTSTQIANYCAAIDRYSPDGAQATASGWMTGANRADIVLVMTLRGILAKSSAKLTEAQTNLSPVFPYVTSGDGFYADGSFIFHNDLAYTGHYGLVLLGDVAELVTLLQGSTWEITDPNLANVYGWVAHAYEPLIYDGDLLDMVRGRAISWSYETATDDGASALSALRLIAAFAPAATAKAINEFVASPRLPSGQFHFPAMDRVLALRAGFGFGISMSSSRVANYESINNGNLHGWFTGDGMTSLYVGSADQTFGGDFWPTVDPYHLPGTTVEMKTRTNGDGEAVKTDQQWVGGAQVNKTIGVAGMFLHGWNTTLYGQKSWFMLDNEIVCLGAGITCTDAADIQTTAENRRLGSLITNSFTLNGKPVTPSVGWSATLPGATASWCALGGVGGYYFPAGAANLQAAFVATSGAWSQINTGDSGTVYTDNYLKLWFDHGTQPTNASYAYVVLPGLTPDRVGAYAANPDMAILANTGDVQAVKKPGMVAANFWTTGTRSVDLITVDNKASVIVSENAKGLAVGVADPTQANTGTILVTLNRAASRLLSADRGVTVTQLSPQIIISVDVKDSRGATLQATFELSPSVVGAAPSAAQRPSFPTSTGYNHQMLYKHSRTDLAWNFLSGVIAGDDTVTDPRTTSARVAEAPAK